MSWPDDLVERERARRLLGGVDRVLLVALLGSDRRDDGPDRGLQLALLARLRAGEAVDGDRSRRGQDIGGHQAVGDGVVGGAHGDFFSRVFSPGRPLGWDPR